MRGFRTDLAMESVGEESGRLEGVSMSAHQIGGVKRTRIVIQSRRAAEALQMAAQPRQSFCRMYSAEPAVSSASTAFSSGWLAR